MLKRAIGSFPFLVAALVVISCGLMPEVCQAQFYGAGSATFGYRSSVGHYHGPHGADKQSYRKARRKTRPGQQKVASARSKRTRQVSRTTRATTSRR